MNAKFCLPASIPPSSFVTTTNFLIQNPFAMNYQIDLIGIKCLDENDSGPWASDEPYVVVTTVCFRDALEGVTLPPGIPRPDINLPKVVTNKFGPWGDVDTGENRSTFEPPDGMTDAAVDSLRLTQIIRKPVWGLNGKPMPISNPDKLFILVGMMEHDDGNPNTVRTAVQTALSGAAAGYASSGLSRNDLAERMRKDMAGAIDLGTLHPFNSDDRIGGVQELRITAANLREARQRGSIMKRLVFRNSTTRYRVSFRIKRA